MQAEDLQHLGALRAVVGFLGEKEQAGWWSSSFFAAGSAAFLSPVFSRTQIVAQCLGAIAAASRVHDERIGVGQVYHLFRLPEDIEQSLHRTLHQTETADRISEHVAHRKAAMSFLQEGRPEKQDAVGPTRVADVSGLRDPQIWLVVAATYADGFDKGTEVYPYFANRK